MVGRNLVLWKSKKQSVVPKSSFEAEYQATTHEACEFLWLRILLYELSFIYEDPMMMYSDRIVL